MKKTRKSATQTIVVDAAGRAIDVALEKEAVVRASDKRGGKGGARGRRGAGAGGDRNSTENPFGGP